MLEKGTNDVDVVDSSQIGHSFAFEEPLQQILDDDFASGNSVKTGFAQASRLHFFHAMDDDARHLRTVDRRQIRQIPEE